MSHTYRDVFLGVRPGSQIHKQTQLTQARQSLELTAKQREQQSRKKMNNLTKPQSKYRKTYVRFAASTSAARSRAAAYSRSAAV